MEDDKVIIKLKKQPLESERKEIRARKRRNWLTVILCVLFLTIGLFAGYLICGASNSYLYKDEHSKFDKIISIIKDNWLYSNDYDDITQTLEDNAYYGMLTFEEDPYTTYMSKEELDSFATNINQDYVGVGVMYSTYADIPKITRVYKNTPGEKAGLRVGDIIIGVDGIEITADNIDKIQDYVKGEANTEVNITVLRDAKEVTLTAIRQEVDTSTYGYENDDYAYIEISSFGESTAEDVEEYLKAFTNSKLIIDLRNDTGGYQTAVESIAGLFIGPNNVYMKQEYSNGQIVIDKTPANIKKYDFDEIVILTNVNTASAAEVLTICLKEYLDNVVIVGETTFGKGVVQSTMMIEDNSAIKFTTSKWLSPINELWINSEGIKPDIEIKQDNALYENIVVMDEEKTYKVDECASEVKLAQMCLKYLDYDIDRTDGYMNEKSMEAIVKFKQDHDIEESEELDYKTYMAIVSAVSYENSVNKEKDNQLQKAIELLSE